MYVQIPISVVFPYLYYHPTFIRCKTNHSKPAIAILKVKFTGKIFPPFKGDILRLPKIEARGNQNRLSG